MADSIILETGASGELQIPAEILNAGPRARFRIEHEGLVVRLVPEAPESADERARAFRQWVARLPKRTGSAIPAEALRRENLYE